MALKTGDGSARASNVSFKSEMRVVHLLLLPASALLFLRRLLTALNESERLAHSRIHVLSGAVDYGNKRVCFRRALFQAKPGPGHIWTSLAWGDGQAAERCSHATATGKAERSWLLQEYNRFNRERWGLLGAEQAADRARMFAVPRVTLVVRKGTNMRVFANEREVVGTLAALPGIEFQAVDFSAIPFADQIATVHNTRWVIE